MLTIPLSTSHLGSPCYYCTNALRNSCAVQQHEGKGGAQDEVHTCAANAAVGLHG